MKSTRRILVALGAIALVALACSFNFSTANFADAYMSSDADGNTRTTTYPQDATFYAIAELANAPDDTVVRAVWTAVNAEGEAPNTLLDDVSFTSGDGTIIFDLTNDLLWPLGEYRVDLYINDELKTSLDFQVQ
jgi:hypothetical protein